MAGMLALIVLNACLVYYNYRRVEQNIAVQKESSSVHADLSGTLQDLTELESAQRGYVLTGDQSYLHPYQDREDSLRSHLGNLHRSLANHDSRDQSMLVQLESLTKSKLEEMAKTIDLRQRDFRLRAFQMVDTNEGKQYMDKARALLLALSDSEGSRADALQRTTDASLDTALGVGVTAELCFLTLTVIIFIFLERRMRQLERSADAASGQVRELENRLHTTLSALNGPASDLLATMQTNVGALLQQYEGFLPRQGQECAERIQQATTELQRLRGDVLANTGGPRAANVQRSAPAA